MVNEITYNLEKLMSVNKAMEIELSCVADSFIHLQLGK
jgi:hypothetical protein